MSRRTYHRRVGGHSFRHRRHRRHHSAAGCLGNSFLLILVCLGAAVCAVR